MQMFSPSPAELLYICLWSPAEGEQEADGGGPPDDPEGRHQRAQLLRLQVAQQLLIWSQNAI
jgi:hypothetical protein